LAHKLRIKGLEFIDLDNKETVVISFSDDKFIKFWNFNDLQMLGCLKLGYPLPISWCFEENKFY